MIQKSLFHNISYVNCRAAFPSFLNCTNVCFHYVPRRFQNRPRDETFWKELSTIPPQIKEAMIKKGSLMIGYQPLPHKGMPNFFRMVIHAMDMEYVIREIDEMGKDL